MPYIETAIRLRPKLAVQVRVSPTLPQSAASESRTGFRIEYAVIRAKTSANDNNVAECYSYGNNHSGILLEEGADDSIVFNVRSYENGLHGFYVVGPVNNLQMGSILSNTTSIHHNNGSGIVFDELTNSLLAKVMLII